VANRIDPVMQQVKASQLKSVVYGSLTEPQVQQLVAPDHPVLSPGELRNLRVVWLFARVQMPSLRLTPI